ncbi:nitric oxide reductase activation protein NorD [Bdellovibrio sp. HCB-162]|uniref:nitric oxide reductase activation protein NorD n=1 Tax=Bdellovibrio sp. HCB-162 TaxID=3394234 RepID=UPI0039BCDB86
MPPHYEQRADLKELETRLQVIAKSLCGEPIQIHEAEKIGGFSGVHFYYPKSLCPLSSKRLNELVYIQRTLFYSSAKQLGFCLPPRELSEIEKKVYTCLAVHQIYKVITLEFPGTIQVIETLRQGTLAELQSLSDQDRNTQNGILAQWIYDLLCESPKDSSWKSILYNTHKSTFSFWKFADAVYQTHFASLPLGPAVAEEAFVLWGLLMSPNPFSEETEKTDEETTTEALANGTEVQGKNREDIVQVHLEEQKDTNNPVTHSFEKAETLEEYQGGMRTQDGDDDLQDHAEALEELNMREVTRSRERTQSLYKADVRMHSVAPDLLSKEDLPVSPRVHFYPEWDFKKKSYKENWCRVQARIPEAGTPFQLAESYTKEKKEIEKLFQQVRSKPLWKKRQRDGEELDIDALVTRHADLKSGNSGEDRFYIRSKKHHKDWQCLFLIDSSLSTDSWVANERILDVIKNSVCLIGDAFTKEPECLSVAAFHSNTRHQCVFEELKNFEESWPEFKRKLNTLEPVGYTRIGPALRHSLEILKVSPARHKLIVLLSDGKASDYDQYEGRYGMEDIRQAVREAHQQNVLIKCLAIEEKAKFYLPQMFGLGHIQILPTPHKLPQALTTLLLPLLH